MCVALCVALCVCAWPCACVRGPVRVCVALCVCAWPFTCVRGPVRVCVALCVCAWPVRLWEGGGGVPGPVRPCLPSRLGAEVEVQDGRRTQGTPPPTSAKLVDSQALSAALRTSVLGSPI